MSAISSLRINVIRISRLHLYFAFFLVVQIIAYDAWRLITPVAVLGRWLGVASLAVVSAVVWYRATSKKSSLVLYERLIFALIAADIGLATFYIYSQRGMASRAVALYAIPIITSSVLRTKNAIFTTATFCAVFYASAAVAYFTLNFNEGYKIELYGEVGFYCVLFFIFGHLLHALMSRSNPN